MKKKKKKVLTVVMILLSLLVAGSGGFLLFKFINNQQSNEKYSELASSYVHATDANGNPVDASGNPVTGVVKPSGSGASTGAVVPSQPNPVNFPSLQTVENDEIYSWLVVPNTLIDYPVLQSKSSDFFYLDHGVDRDYRFAGAIYSQFCNKTDYSDRVTVLYGHNMADGSMFGTLDNFSDPDFFSANKDMFIYTPDKQLVYEVVSAYIGDDSHILNSYDFSKDEVYRDFLNNVLHPHSVQSVVREGATLDINDRIVILSTCVDYGAGRWLVVGKLIGEIPLAPTA